MKSYPVSIRRASYRGVDARKRAKTDEYNRVATKVEQHLNGDLSKQPDHTVHQYDSYEIALKIAESDELVHRIVFATDCGANGITIVKGDFDKAMKLLHGED